VKGGTVVNKKASEMMGEPVAAGVRLEAAELTREAVGWVAGKVLTGSDVEPASLPGDHEGIHYVAVGSTKVGFFSMKQGFFKNSLEELLVERPRSEVKVVEIEGGAMPKAHFVFEDGTHYALMCPRMNLGALKDVRELLLTE
jgi:hypothetical protein